MYRRETYCKQLQMTAVCNFDDHVIDHLVDRWCLDVNTADECWENGLRSLMISPRMRGFIASLPAGFSSKIALHLELDEMAIFGTLNRGNSAYVLTMNTVKETDRMLASDPEDKWFSIQKDGTVLRDGQCSHIFFRKSISWQDRRGIE